MAALKIEKSTTRPVQPQRHTHTTPRHIQALSSLSLTLHAHLHITHLHMSTFRLPGTCHTSAFAHLLKFLLQQPFIFKKVLVLLMYSLHLLVQ